MNLAANDVTSIDVSGDIFNGSTFTSIDLSKYVGAQGLDLSDLSLAVNNKIGDTFISEQPWPRVFITIPQPKY